MANVIVIDMPGVVIGMGYITGGGIIGIVVVRGHPRVPTSPTEYLCLKTPNTFRLNDTPYIPPHRRRLYDPYLNSSPSQPPLVS